MYVKHHTKIRFFRLRVLLKKLFHKQLTPAEQFGFGEIVVIDTDDE